MLRNCLHRKGELGHLQQSEGVQDSPTGSLADGAARSPHQEVDRPLGGQSTASPTCGERLAGMGRGGGLA